MAAKKCLGCGADKFFDPESGKLKCEHCGGEYPLENEKPAGDILVKYLPSYQPTKREDEERHYECSSCGSVVTFKSGDSLRCPSCGDVALVQKRVGVCIPDGIIPFKVGRDKAAQIFKDWSKKRKLAPNDFKKLAKLGKISGQYVPMWAYNFKLSGSYRGEVSWTEQVGKNKTVKHRKPIFGKINKTYINVPVSGNLQFDDKYMRGLAPFNVEGTMAYSNEYLFGFSGLDTDRNANSAHEDMLAFTKRELENEIRREEGRGKYVVDWLNIDATSSDETLRYVYAPIWASHFTYKNKKYHAYINGETGAVTGKAPVSFWKVLFIVLGVLAVIGGLVYAVNALE